LATNPEIQEKAYQEVHSYLKRDQRITHDIINKLSYLKAVVKETFRYESQEKNMPFLQNRQNRKIVQVG
jgi:cytochrome P450